MQLVTSRNSGVLLTPAQHAFLRRTITGYKESQWKAESAGAAGSDRRFVRLCRTDDESHCYILIVWDSSDPDWRRFLSIQEELPEASAFLPRIFASDRMHGLILEEDLGRDTLHKLVSEGQSLFDLYSKTLDALVEWQRMPSGRSPTISGRAMDQEMFLWESEYFATHCVTEYFGCERLLTGDWERTRKRIAEYSSGQPQVCIHRDFQSENILLHKGGAVFVDYQGARLGPPEYDLASLLFDPYVEELDHSLRERLLAYYRKNCGYAFDPGRFTMISAQRLMQALGAYGNLSIHKGKQRFRRYIGPALQRLHEVIRDEPQLSTLREIVAECLRRQNSTQGG